jgi:hypothetical protein
MHITSWFTHNFEDRLQGRYITLKHVKPLLDSYHEIFDISVAGTSEMGEEIPLVTFGHGAKKVLIWSQMHGNESTTTKALFDFFKFISSNKEISDTLVNDYTFYVLPILNPDGAALYTRENAHKVDLNRDAQQLSQKESIVLKSLFDEVQPNLCLNMHDQRTVFGLSAGFPATVSFLSPAAEVSRKVTPARQEAMGLIVKMTQYLQVLCPNQMGRFDDGYNQNCVGDTFTRLGVPTILFEAGHYQNDYDREQTRAFVFYSLIALFDLDPTAINASIDYSDYFNIPENQKNFKDVVLFNVRVPEKDVLQTLSFQYKEVLRDKTIVFELYLDSIDEDATLYGHQTFDLQGGAVLLNSQGILAIGQQITTIFDKSQNLMLI